ncbi:hypothetical protein HK098_007656 [Nowakowskiella sp. JEL0407]|nr:hypothetical protein HK098_007656 [Nowakowskiella sp. JEL0407]
MSSKRDYFNSFINAEDAVDTLSSFNTIRTNLSVADAKVTSLSFFDAIYGEYLPHLPFKHKRLFELLRNRWIKTETYRKRLQEKNSNSRILISGAGPCGLRVAVEAAMVGMKVHIVERRSSFSRHNIIKTWSCTISDLLSLGLQVYYPQFKPHGHLHLGTREIQLCLLKTALLLGVTIEYETCLCAVVKPVVGVTDCWNGLTSNIAAANEFWSGSQSLMTENSEASDNAEEPQELALKPGEGNVERLQKTTASGLALGMLDYFEAAESQSGGIVDMQRVKEGVHNLIPFDALLVAEGERSKLIRNLGFDRKVTRFGPAIGIVVNILVDPKAKAIPEFVVSRGDSEWRKSALGGLDQRGIVLENMEYMRGSTHFIAATVMKQSLVDQGVFKMTKPTVRECLHPENVDIEKLHGLARTLATAVNIPENAPFAAKNGVQIFNFSTKGLCVQYYKVLESAVDSSIVLPIGDALQNPYWPQGLGVNRGFHNSLDALWSVYLWFLGENEQSKEDRVIFFKIMDWVVFSEKCLTPPDSWEIDPVTRYSPWLFQSMHRQELELKAAQFTLSKRIRDLYKLQDLISALAYDEQSIQFTYPTEFQSWSRGDKISVTWNYTGFDPDTELVFLMSSFFSGNAVLIPNIKISQQQVNFTVPYDVNIDELYKIYLYSPETKYVDGPSVRIVKSSRALTITDPLTKTYWAKGTNVTVSWENDGWDGNMEINIILANRYFSKTITQALISDQNVTFTVPSYLKNDETYYLYLYNRKIEYVNGPKIIILAAADAAYLPLDITITSPTEPERWSMLSEQTVRWNYTRATDDVPVTIVISNRKQSPTIAKAQLYDKNVTFTVPYNLDEGNYTLYLYTDETDYIDGTTITIDGIATK